MKQVPIKLGPLALLLTVISICLTVLSILNFTTARADLRLAEKYAETVSERYALEAEGQELLRELEASDPALLDMTRDAAGVWHADLERDGAHLRLAVEKKGDGWQVVEWRMEKDWQEDTGLELWGGGFFFE